MQVKKDVLAKIEKPKLNNINIILYYMAQTRSISRSKMSKKKVYRSRVKSSQCRGKTFTNCRRRNGCKVTMKGRRRSYCRKYKNQRT